MSIKALAVNIAGAERLLRAIHSCKWESDIVMASTSEVYGNRFHYGEGNPGVPTDSAQICPATLRPCKDIHNRESNIELREDMELVVSSNLSARTNYSVSKLADELFGLSYARQFNLKARMIRFFNVVGPRQTGKYGMVVPRFVAQAVEGKPITVYGDGSQTRSFMDVRDTVVALDRLASTRTVWEKSLTWEPITKSPLPNWPKWSRKYPGAVPPSPIHRIMKPMVKVSTKFTTAALR